MTSQIPQLIGLYSPAAQSGKTTVATTLGYTHGYTIVSFASPIKYVIANFLCQLGYAANQATYLTTVDKEAMIPELGVSARHLMRTLGTEWGRECVCPDVWLKCWEVQCRKVNGPIVVDDVRFPNEFDLVKKLGGRMWRIERPGVQRLTYHASEGGLDKYAFDATLVNAGTVDDLDSTLRLMLM
jgi:hypothetical protein